MANIALIQLALDNKAKSIRAKYGLPNIAGVIVRDNGNTIMHTVQGIRDASKNAAAAGNQATKADYFNVGSISKPITGFLIACLIKKGGVLTWGTRIRDVFPEFTSKTFRDRCGMNDSFLDTTVYELLGHTSGMNGSYYHIANNDEARDDDTDPFRYIQDQGMFNKGNDRYGEWRSYPALMYLRYLFTVLSLKKKKYKFNSSTNLGYQSKAKAGYGATATICAAMAERKTGKPWEQIMKELKASPLGGRLHMINGSLPNGMQLHTYDAASGLFIPLPDYNDIAPYDSKFVVGGIQCTVDGMAQFIRYNLRAVDSSAVFDIEQYQQPVTVATRGGLFLGGEAKNEPLNHNGATGGSLASMYIYHHSGRGFAAMMNCGGGPSDAPFRSAIGEMIQAMQEIHRNWDTI
ncbi:serine hydrolase domain-containing protein [Chitinophaga sp. 22620]|uniref:serine hydrolase domain-containing protein n=1 Tax=Chitinophaga sp. 22620 TaxID=3453952 RepID=UPI003F840749